MFQRTKKLFKRSIETFKSFFSDGYQKLPKTPSYNVGFSPANIYSEFVDQWESADRVMTIANEKNTDLKHMKSSMLINCHEVDGRKQPKNEETTIREREEKRCLVSRRLKEVELLDGNNVDHVHDIQEVLYCYSRLTCPVYREIVDKFLTDIFSEVLSTPRHNSSIAKINHTFR